MLLLERYEQAAVKRAALSAAYEVDDPAALLDMQGELDDLLAAEPPRHDPERQELMEALGIVSGHGR